MFEFFRIIDATHDDPTFVPCLSAPDAAFPFEWEPEDGGQPQVFTTKTASVSQYSGRGWTEVKRLKDITLTVVVTEARVVVYCEKFTKGGGWRGFGVGGLAVALVANAVSHAKAAARRRGKLLVAQARYPWLSAVGAPTDKRGRQYALRLVADAGTSTEPRTLALDLFLKERDRPDAWAATVATLAARYRLATGAIDPGSRPTLERIASGSETGPFDLPAHVRVGASTPVAALQTAPVAEPVYAVAPAEPAARPEAPAAVDNTDTLPDTGRAGCSACGASLTPGMPTCGRCGSAVVQPAAAVPVDVPRPAAAAVDDVEATTRRSAFVHLHTSAEPAVLAAGVSETQANPAWGGIEDTQVVPDFQPSLPGGYATDSTTGSAQTVYSAPSSPAYPPQRLSFGMTPRGTGPVAAPPEVWLVSVGLLVLAGLVLYPVLKFAGPLVPHLFDGNEFSRAFAALFLEFAVVLVACGAALVALAWGLIRGSRVAQVLTCLLAAVVSLGEVIGTQSNEQGTPSVSTGIAVSCVLVTTVIIALLVGSTGARGFFARDTRPAGVVVAATACLYLGGVAVLDGLLLMVAGTIAHRLVWYGIGFAAVGLLLITGNVLLRRASSAARGTTVAGFLAFAVILLMFAGKYDELSSTSTLVPLGLLIAATVGLLVPPRSQEFFASGGAGYAPPLSRSPGLVVGVSALLVAILAAVSIGLSSHDSASDSYGDGDNQASSYTPSYSYSSDTAAPVSSSSDITQSDAQGTATATMEALEGNGSADVCDGDDLPSIDVYDYRIRDVAPQTSGTFQVSADVSLSDGSYETVSYLVTDDGTGSPCVESDSFDTQTYTPDDSTSSDQPSVPSVEPTDVPSVPSSGDPVPTDAPLPTTPAGAVVPYDSDTTPTNSDQIVEYQASGLDDDQTSAVSSVIGFMAYVNQQDFSSAWNQTTYSLHSGTPTSSFKHGYATSRFYQVEFGEPKELAGDLIVVPARFVSRQDPDAQGDPSGVTSCSYWPQYMFTVVNVDGQWLVDTSGSYAHRPELTPLKRLGSSGPVLNPTAQREDCS